jgi:hypothetical protein
MSHFAVWVVGDNVDEQLAPYDEGLHIEPYKEYWNGKQEETVIRLLGKDNEEFVKELETKTSNAERWSFMVNTWNEHYEIQPGDSEYLYFDEFGIYAMSTYNPDSKWDWYQIGGRWAGEFKAKDGFEHLGIVGEKSWGMEDEDPYANNYFDGLPFAAIDFDAMITYRVNRAGQLWDEWHEKDALGEKQLPKSWALGADPEETKEEYLERVQKTCITPFAMCVDGTWYEKGKMGWFGVSTDEVSQDDWVKFVHKTLNELDGNTMVTMVDCHI